MKKLIVRTITGATFVAALIGSMLYSHVTFGAMFMLITLLAVNEFCTLVEQYKKTTFNKWIAIAGGCVLFLASFFVFNFEVANPLKLFLPYILIMAYAFIGQLFDKNGKTLDNVAYFSLSQVYAALPFALLNMLAAGHNGYSFVLPLSIFIFIWSNDTGAFCFGCTLGRHKMFERVSPKKTWEGFAGGAMVAVVAGYVMSLYFNIMDMYQWMGMALVVVVFATLGDLIESSMKREMQIKDSGNMLPGHGGILDRFDSTLLAIPAVIIYLNLIGIL